MSEVLRDPVGPVCARHHQQPGWCCESWTQTDRFNHNGFCLGLNEMYVWFLLPTYPNFFNPTLNIKMVFGEKIPKMGTFSDFATIFFVKCYNKI